MSESYKCIICNSTDYKIIAKIDKRPVGETDYGIPEDKYFREIGVCNTCGVFFNKHNLLEDSLYKGDYNSAISLGNLLDRFNKITALPFEKSDNKQRVQRIIDFLEFNNYDLKNTDILDIGSGTCVFLHEVKKHKLRTFCLDPDPAAVEHAKMIVGVDMAFHGFVGEFSTKMKFDIITLNKVLEHLKNPVEIINHVSAFLKHNGVLYLELPHGDPIQKDGNVVERQEFFVEHYTIYNDKSIRFLAEITGFKIIEIHGIFDPSGKYTIYAFLYRN